MTAQEVYNHNWKEGEIIYGIRRRYSGGDLKLSQWYKQSGSKIDTGVVYYPEEVIPLKVVKIDHPIYKSCSSEFLFIDFEEDLTKESVYGDYKICVNISTDKNGIVKKVTPNFDKSHLECKFFTKEEAEAYIPVLKRKIIKLYNSSIKNYKNHIENLKKEIECSVNYIKSMQESIDKIS